jgi:NADH:ubiquinone oxidoreductase subunit F (NADH-binding)
MLTFRNAEEQAAWTLAEALSEKGFAAMRQAEEAAENFRVGKQMTRSQFKQRGLTEVDADIRFAGTTRAKKALSDNGWYMSQAAMYHEAAAAQYAKALYLNHRDNHG